MGHYGYRWCEECLRRCGPGLVRAAREYPVLGTLNPDAALFNLEQRRRIIRAIALCGSCKAWALHLQDELEAKIGLDQKCAVRS